MTVSQAIHALIAPSALALTVECPASVLLQASVPLLPVTEEEAEGTAAHWVAMRYAAGYGQELPIGAKFTSAGREWEVDADMVAGAMMYQRAMGGPHLNLRLEDAVSIPRIHPEHCHGTPDAWRYAPDAREMYQVCPPEMPAEKFYAGQLKLVRVGDYKFGHRFVEVFENYQGTGYISGVMHRLQLNDNDPDLWVEFILVQPRCYHRDGPVRVWRVHASDLRATLNVAASAAREALAPNPRARTNDGCIDCKARHACKTLQHATSAFIEFSTTAEVVEMPAEALGQELSMVQDAIKRLEARETGLSAQAETLLRQGKPVAFYHLTPGQSRLTYKDDADIDELVSFGDLVGVDIRKPQTKKDCLVTPTQAIALGIDENAMKSYAHRPPAALKLARDNSITARKVFSK